MGTNYYAHTNFCSHCERYDEIHIGKSSFGWKFAIEIHEFYYKSLKEFEEFIQKEDVEIWNSYGDKITPEEVFKMIDAKAKSKSHFDAYPKEKYADCEEVDLHKGEFS